MPLAPWRCADGAVVHATKWFAVRRDQVIRPDGNADVYHHVLAPGSATVLAIDNDDRVALTRQWIYTHDSRQWRLPGGGVDPADASPMAAAQRELAEEVGLRALHWEPIGQVHGADSFTNHVDHVFLATGLVRDAGQRLEPGEADLEVHWLSIPEVVRLAGQSKLRHAGSAFAVLSLALRRGLCSAR